MEAFALSYTLNSAQSLYEVKRTNLTFIFLYLCGKLSIVACCYLQVAGKGIIVLSLLY